MTQFRPCIDLHKGSVKQIVGGTLSNDSSELKTNFVSDKPAAYFAERYKADNLQGGHIIQLGPGNTEAAQSALKAYPSGMQIGGGINLENASAWLKSGASHIIVTSWLFDNNGHFMESNLDALVSEVGKEKLVIDLSCRRTEQGWTVAMNRWQTLTNLSITSLSLNQLASSCDEFLIHAADVEGKCEGIDEDLVRFIGAHSPIPSTYAGGAYRFEDLRTVETLSNGRVNLTIGSALDLFGGNAVRYTDCVEWNQRK